MSALTTLKRAQAGEIIPEMELVAKDEGISPETIRQEIAAGRVVICKNRHRAHCKPVGIGKHLKTKVNANIGSSENHADIQVELDKLRVAIKAGADTVMDLSTGGPIKEIRQAILRESSVPIGTVPIYQTAIDTIRKGKKGIVEMSVDDIFSIIQEQGEEGVDFVTVHCGITRQAMARINSQGRLLDVVSRGGSFLSAWMAYNNKENPLYEHFDHLLEIAAEHELVLSLGDGLRPGCIADATDRGQIQELIMLGELTQRAHDFGVQVMIEGPGHVPINQIEANVLLEKSLCREAPFYVLGPVVTDIAPGYDHITSAIGGAIAAAAGANFLCYVTPSEHLRLPTVEDVRVGVIVTRIAAHAADVSRGVASAVERDNQMARFRKDLDWEGQIETSLDPETARKLWESSPSKNGTTCTMCGDYCAIKLIKTQKKNHSMPE
ncbi:MAG: phosphomethylpyrimidine synthase ThiC [Deltaproteobacteria bacterium]|nr:phosphomethylpyrimidine synthase ThiC [Deltaproteobacteria bacterium]